MRKKMLGFIVKETKYRKINSTTIDPTLEESYYLYNKHNISSTKVRTKFIYPITNQVVFLDTIDFCRE